MWIKSSCSIFFLSLITCSASSSVFRGTSLGTFHVDPSWWITDLCKICWLVGRVFCHSACPQDSRKFYPDVSAFCKDLHQKFSNPEEKFPKYPRWHPWKMDGSFSWTSSALLVRYCCSCNVKSSWYCCWDSRIRGSLIYLLCSKFLRSLHWYLHLKLFWEIPSKFHRSCHFIS